MIAPTIHLNGTSAASLVDALWGAYCAAVNLEGALIACHPHGRDYYPQGDDAIGQAIDESRARQYEAYRIRQAIDAILEGIRKQDPTGYDEGVRRAEERLAGAKH